MIMITIIYGARRRTKEGLLVELALQHEDLLKASDQMAMLTTCSAEPGEGWSERSADLSERSPYRPVLWIANLDSPTRRHLAGVFGPCMCATLPDNDPALSKIISEIMEIVFSSHYSPSRAVLACLPQRHPLLSLLPQCSAS